MRGAGASRASRLPGSLAAPEFHIASTCSHARARPAACAVLEEVVLQMTLRFLTLVPFNPCVPRASGPRRLASARSRLRLPPPPRCVCAQARAAAARHHAGAAGLDHLVRTRRMRGGARWLAVPLLSRHSRHVLPPSSHRSLCSSKDAAALVREYIHDKPDLQCVAARPCCDAALARMPRHMSRRSRSLGCVCVRASCARPVLSTQDRGGGPLRGRPSHASQRRRGACARCAQTRASRGPSSALTCWLCPCIVPLCWLCPCVMPRRRCCTG
jgi:hypothetical protein